MTMVALLGHPAKSDSLSPHTTVSTQCQFSKDSPATYPAPQQPETHEFYLPAVLRDIPTDVPTTADTDDDDDDDRRRCHPSITVDDFTTTAPTFLQEKDTFYTELLQLAHSLGVSTQTTNEELHDSLAAASTADNDSPAINDPDSIHAFLSELNDLHNELTLLLPQPSSSYPRTPANDACDIHNRNNEYANNDRDDNNDNDNAERSIAAYDKDDYDISERVNNECDNIDNNDNSTGAATPRTTENIIEHEPTDSVVATSDPPIVADPEPHHAFQNLAGLQSETTYLPCSPNTFPSSTRSNHKGALPTATRVNDAKENDDRNNNERKINERQNDNHNADARNLDNCATNNHGNIKSTVVATSVEIAATGHTTAGREHDHNNLHKHELTSYDHVHEEYQNNDRALDEYDTNKTDKADSGNDDCETADQYQNDSADQRAYKKCTPTHLHPTPLNRQSTLHLDTTHDSTKPKCKSHNDTAPPAITGSDLENGKTRSNDTNSPRPTLIEDTPNTTLKRLWFLLKQLEEINIQFARLLDTLTIPKTSRPFSNSLAESLKPPDPPIAPMPTTATTLALPKTPSPTDPNPLGKHLILQLPLGTRQLTHRTPPWPPHGQ